MVATGLLLSGYGFIRRGCVHIHAHTLSHKYVLYARTQVPGVVATGLLLGTASHAVVASPFGPRVEKLLLDVPPASSATSSD